MSSQQTRLAKTQTSATHFKVKFVPGYTKVIPLRLLPSPTVVDIADTWERPAMTLIDAGGKTTDLNQSMQKVMP